VLVKVCKNKHKILISCLSALHHKKKSNSVEQSPWKANSHLASQEICPFFNKLWSSLPCSQVPTTGPYLEWDVSSPHLPTHFLKTHSDIILLSETVSIGVGTLHYNKHSEKYSGEW